MRRASFSLAPRRQVRWRDLIRTSGVDLSTIIRTAGGSDALAGASTVDDVDAIVRRALKAGDIPTYIATEPWWGGKVIINENGHTLEVLFAPDYGAIDRTHPMRIGKESEFLAQEYADYFNSILPSQKLLRAGEAAANPKIPFIGVQTPSGGADDSVGAVVRANDLADAAFAKYGTTQDDGRLKIGYKKAYVVKPNLNGDYLAIYGGRWTSAGGLVQPPSGHAHTTGQIAGTPNYSDYSHGIVLVSRKATLDGVPVDLRNDVFGSKDPAIYGLVSDEGRFDPVFPNAGSGTVARFSAGSEEDAPESFADMTGSNAAIGEPSGPSAGHGRLPIVVGAGAGLLGGVAFGLAGWPLVGTSAAGALLGRWYGQRKAA